MKKEILELNISSFARFAVVTWIKNKKTGALPPIFKKQNLEEMKK